MSEICLKTKNIRWSLTDGQEFQYIDLSSVDRQNNAISETQTVHSENAPSRAQQIVEEGDVLFGTTRPTLMRYCSVPKEFDGQIASTGYCVLRPDLKQVHPRWIFHLISSSAFFKYVDENQKGAGYPSISDAEVMKWKVPVPPIDEQERIVGVLDNFNELVNNLSTGLPAELKARRQQYEHYRDRLLTFKEASA